MVGLADGDGDAAEEFAAGMFFGKERAVRAEVEGEDRGAGTQRDKSRPVIELHKAAGQGHAAFREDEEGRAPRDEVGDLLQGVGVHGIDLDGVPVARKGAEKDFRGHCPVHDDLQRQPEVRPDKQAVKEGGVVGDHDEPGRVPRHALQALDPDAVDKTEIELEKKAQALLEARPEKAVHEYYITRRAAAFHFSSWREVLKGGSLTLLPFSEEEETTGRT